MSRHAKALKRIAAILGGMEQRPRMFAWHPETLELSFVALVDLRQVLAGYDDFDVHAAWCSFIEQINGEPNNVPLYAILRDEGMLAELPRLMGDFARWVAREWPPR
jgi:hypothetical protein